MTMRKKDEFFMLQSHAQDAHLIFYMISNIHPYLLQKWVVYNLKLRIRKLFVLVVEQVP